MSTEKIILDEEKISKFIKDALSAVKTEVSPEELNEYRRLFRKSVPLTMRAYVAGYLIKQCAGKFVHSKTSNRVANPKVALAPDVSTSLFISVGRKRRVFPKDIITLIMKNVEIPRENIGEIRILDNYSFVQVMSENAEEIISKVNGIYYRGKPLALSYAHNTADKREPAGYSDSTFHGNNTEV
ncbi:MAG: RNA-binding protein [Treponema sp.]|nr:MAG: RNA-binding protein [Treponema sp.]